MENNVSFIAELASLHPMLEWIRVHLEKVGLSDIEIKRLEIAIEEGLVNIISYAYQGERGTIEIAFHYEERKYVEFTITDSGLAFNPLKHKKEIDPFVPIEQLEAGGLGIVFMHKLMDKVEYHRRKGKNHLILRKELS